MKGTNLESSSGLRALSRPFHRRFEHQAGQFIGALNTTYPVLRDFKHQVDGFTWASCTKKIDLPGFSVPSKPVHWGFERRTDSLGIRAPNRHVHRSQALSKQTGSLEFEALRYRLTWASNTKHINAMGLRAWSELVHLYLRYQINRFSKASITKQTSSPGLLAPSTHSPGLRSVLSDHKKFYHTGVNKNLESDKKLCQFDDAVCFPYRQHCKFSVGSRVNNMWGRQDFKQFVGGKRLEWSIFETDRMMSI